jgi:hypothetical protein
MRKKLLLPTVVIMALMQSCQKSADITAHQFNGIEVGGTQHETQGVTPYQFERVNEHNFFSQGWKEQQVNIVSGATLFSDQSDYVQVVCGPENNGDPRLIQGCVTMNLPTASDPTLRRIRLRKGGYSGTFLSDLTDLKYSTYVVRNAPTIMVLQVDINGDEDKDFNIFFSPTQNYQGTGFPPLLLNTWQQWNALEGKWEIEATTVPLPQFPRLECTIQQLVDAFPTARIIDTPPAGQNGEGVRFTIGGNPRSLYDNTIGYFDALIIGTKDQQHATLFDFTCDQSDHNKRINK